MKRLAIFTLLFPPIAALVFMAPDVIRKLELPPLDIFVPFVLIAYPVALVPAWVSAAADYGLRQYALRTLGTVIVGVIAALLAARYHGHIISTTSQVLVVVMMGALPAAVCSWLSGENQK